MSRDPELMGLIGPYVLGACTPDEAAEVRARMVVDAAFRREVESYAAVREALLEVPTPDVTPDPGAKARIMNLVREEASLFAAAVPAETKPESRDRGSRSWGSRLGAALAALGQPRQLAILGSVVVLIVVAGVAIGTGGSSDDRDSTVRVVANVLGPAAPKGQAEVVVDDGAGQIRVSGFPSPGAGRKYQVWVRSGQGTPRATTVLFDVDRNGNGTADIPARTMVGVDEVMLTAEPAGGSTAPTSPPVLQVAMPA